MTWEFFLKTTHLGLLATIEAINNDDEPCPLTSERVQAVDHVHHQENLIFECLGNRECSQTIFFNKNF